MEKIPYKLNALESPKDDRDWKAEQILSTEVNLPEEFSWQDKSQYVRDQGGQGSCVAMSCAAVKEVHEYEDTGFEGLISPQFIYNNRVNQDGEGMYPRDAMQILQKIGSLPDDDYPYMKIEKPENMSPKILQDAKNYRITSYASVDTIDGLKLALFKNGPCLFTVPVYNMGGTMWKPQNADQKITGGHAMACIGYNKEGFILKNSWGKTWNGNGYTVFPYSDWGMQGEVWTTIDDNSSKPDPRFTKWYWKVWRYLKTYYSSFGPGIFMGLGANLVILGLSIFYDHRGLYINGASVLFLIIKAILDYREYLKAKGKA